MRSKLQAAGLSDIAPGIERASRLGLALEVAPYDTGARSFVGGVPALPAGFVWPSRHGTPLPFLLQIDLAEIAPSLPSGELPATGRLLLFGVPDDADERYAAAVAPLTRGWNDVFATVWLNEPGTPRTEGVAMPARAIRFHAMTAPPDRRSAEVRELLATLARDDATDGDDIDEGDMSIDLDLGQGFLPPAKEETPEERYASFVDSLALPSTHLLGHAQSIQDDVRVEALLEQEDLTAPLDAATSARIETTARRWKTVLRLGSIPQIGWRFSSDGVLFLVAPTAALREGRFDAIRAVIQR